MDGELNEDGDIEEEDDDESDGPDDDEEEEEAGGGLLVSLDEDRAGVAKSGAAVAAQWFKQDVFAGADMDDEDDDEGDEGRRSSRSPRSPKGISRGPRPL